MQTFNTIIGLSANAASNGQGVDFDGAVVSGATINNTSSVGIEYTTDGSTWTAVAAGSSAAPTISNPALFRLRKLASDSYPVQVGMAWTAGENVARLSTDANGGVSLMVGGVRHNPGIARQSLLTVACGNSISSQSKHTGTAWNTNGELQLANMFCGSAMRFTRMAATTRSDLNGVYGYGGQTLDTINGDVDVQWFAPMHTASVVPDLVIGLALLENDVATDATYAQMVGRLTRWIANVRRFPGVMILLCTPRPSNSYNTAARVSAYQAITEYMLSLDDGKSVFVSRLNGYENPASPGTPLAGFTDATVHPNTKGAMRNARAIAATLKRIAGAVTQPYRVLSSNYGLVGSAAVAATNSTGTAPTGSSVAGTANGTYVSTAENPGWLVNISQAAGASSDLSTINTGSVAIAGGANTQVSTFAEIEIVSGAQNLRWIALEPRIADGGGNNFQYGINIGTADADGEFVDGDVLTLRVPPQIAGLSPITGVNPYIRPQMKTNGSGNVIAAGSISFRVRSTGVGIVVA